MGRTIVAGSEVVVRSTPRSPRPFEVWAYCSDSGAIVVHRFRRHTEAGLVFRGDAQWWLDAAVPESQLIGRVTHVTTGGRTRSVGAVERAVWIARLASRRLRRGH